MQSLTMGICFIDVWLIIRVLKFLLPRPVVTRLARLHASQFIIKDYWDKLIETKKVLLYLKISKLVKYGANYVLFNLYFL